MNPTVDYSFEMASYFDLHPVECNFTLKQCNREGYIELGTLNEN